MPLAKDDSSYKGLEESQIAFIENRSWGGLFGFIFFLFNKVYVYPFIVLLLFLTALLYPVPKGRCIHTSSEGFLRGRCLEYSYGTNYQPFIISLLVVAIIAISIYGLFIGRKVVWKKRNWNSFEEYQTSMIRWDRKIKIPVKILGILLGAFGVVLGGFLVTLWVLGLFFS